MIPWELDSFYLKFKNLLFAEKDATLTLKSESGIAFITLSLDLGHVLSGEDHLPPRGYRNGPARQRRREKRAAAHLKKHAAEKPDYKDVESTETVKKPTIVETPDAEEAVETTTDVQAKSDFNNGNNTTETVDKKDTDVEDVFCPNKIYEKPNEVKMMTSMGTQTLETGLRQTTPNRVLDYYTLRYEDPDSE